MNNPSLQSSSAIQALTEANETLLKSKSRLQQDVIGLKKQLITQEQQYLLLQTELEKVDELRLKLHSKEQDIAEQLAYQKKLEDEIRDLREALMALSTENLRLKRRKWYQVLLGKG
ncbi:MAG: hypothetical protein J7527_17305 [Chitinophagaceae bacterium]|nr:hypothetical protein [Chitinophagaceae bacterium]